MTKFYFTNTAGASPFNGTNKYSMRSSHTPADAGTTILTSVAASAAGANVGDFATDVEQPHNSATWPTTGWGYSMDIKTASSDLTYTAIMYRYSSAGVLIDICDAGMNPTGLTGTGVKTATGQTNSAINNNGFGTGAATDKIRWAIGCSNANMMSASNFEIYISDSQSWLEGTNLTPGGGGGPTPFTGWGFVPL